MITSQGRRGSSRPATRPPQELDEPISGDERLPLPIADVLDDAVDRDRGFDHRGPDADRDRRRRPRASRHRTGGPGSGDRNADRPRARTRTVAGQLDRDEPRWGDRRGRFSVGNDDRDPPSEADVVPDTATADLPRRPTAPPAVRLEQRRRVRHPRSVARQGSARRGHRKRRTPDRSEHRLTGAGVRRRRNRGVELTGPTAKPSSSPRSSPPRPRGRSPDRVLLTPAARPDGPARRTRPPRRGANRPSTRLPHRSKRRGDDRRRRRERS